MADDDVLEYYSIDVIDGYILTPKQVLEWWRLLGKQAAIEYDKFIQDLSIYWNVDHIFLSKIMERVFTNSDNVWENQDIPKTLIDNYAKYNNIPEDISTKFLKLGPCRIFEDLPLDKFDDKSLHNIIIRAFNGLRKPNFQTPVDNYRYPELIPICLDRYEEFKFVYGCPLMYERNWKYFIKYLVDPIPLTSLFSDLLLQCPFEEVKRDFYVFRGLYGKNPLNNKDGVSISTGLKYW